MMISVFTSGSIFSRSRSSTPLPRWIASAACPAFHSESSRTSSSTILGFCLSQARAWLKQNPKIVLLDVREDSEWNAGHAAEAIHLGKGVLERDLEKILPDVNTEIIMYCGGGYRSILTCDAAQKM